MKMNDVNEINQMWRDVKEIGKEKKSNNLENSLKLLKERNYEVKELSDTHYRIGGFDFWPSTGKYLNRKTNKYKRGVFNLIRDIDKSTYDKWYEFYTGKEGSQLLKDWEKKTLMKNKLFAEKIRREINE